MRRSSINSKIIEFIPRPMLGKSREFAIHYENTNS